MMKHNFAPYTNWCIEDNHFSTVRIEVNTIFEKKAVHFAGTFLRLKDGLNYLGYAEATIPEKKITLHYTRVDRIII